MTVIEIEFPTLPVSPSTKYWRLQYEVGPMLSAFDTLPSCVTLAMQLAATAAPPLEGVELASPPAPIPSNSNSKTFPSEVKSCVPSAPTRSDSSSFALFSDEKKALLQDVAFGSLRMALPPPTGNDASDAARC